MGGIWEIFSGWQHFLSLQYLFPEANNIFEKLFGNVTFNDNTYDDVISMVRFIRPSATECVRFLGLLGSLNSMLLSDTFRLWPNL